MSQPARFRWRGFVGGVAMVLVAQWAACSGSVPTHSGGGGTAGTTSGTAGNSGSGGAAVTGAGGGQVTGAGGGGPVTGAGGGSSASGGAPGGTGTGTGGSTMTRDGGGPDLAPPTGPGPGTLGGGPVTTSTTHLDIGVHDPSMIWDGSNYYLFATGGTLSDRKSANLMQWTTAGKVYPAIPAWATAIIGSGLTSLWAPDISYFNGLFHVYYAGSTFGSNTSVIGLATNVALDATKAGYAWVDQGLVIAEQEHRRLQRHRSQRLRSTRTAPPGWRSGRSGRASSCTSSTRPPAMFATDDPTLYSIAVDATAGRSRRRRSSRTTASTTCSCPSTLCCKGVSSTYRTMVGRASAITGPYADSTGKAMMQGSGGDQLLATDGRYIGPGGGTAWKDGDNYLYVYHYYDGDANGASKLLIRPITFTADDWIVLGDPIFP